MSGCAPPPPAAPAHAPLGIGIIGRHRQHGQETLGRGVQLLSLQCPLRLPQALVHRARQGFLAGRQIGMTGIELAGTTQDRGRLGQLSAPGQRARLQQQVAQRIFAPFQRRQVVRLQGQDALEQGQRTAVAIIQPAGRERVARLGQQRTNTGSGAASRLQLAGDRIGFALRHLQLTGQRQCLRAAVQIVGLQASRACCSAAAPVRPGPGAPAGDHHPAPAPPGSARAHHCHRHRSNDRRPAHDPFGQQLFDLRLIQNQSASGLRSRTSSTNTASAATSAQRQTRRAWRACSHHQRPSRRTRSSAGCSAPCGRCGGSRSMRAG
jgi:hypothetical protein